MLDPIRNADHTVFLFGVSDNHRLNTRIDHRAFAHHAAVGARHRLARLRVRAAKVQRRADHLLARRRNDCIHLGMHGAAKLVSLAARQLQLLTDAPVQISAVLSAARRTVIACGKDAVVLHNNRAKATAHAGRALRDRLRNI